MYESLLALSAILLLMDCVIGGRTACGRRATVTRIDTLRSRF
ncbi:putative membrane protein [Gluconacetobacter diazotrophicus PA1 5]|uniref:Putative membrane protein n=1 Tax=Gluconacetobacter diazotrophicus (strain ATCC 49037 / DSM 5601 / CCUG 37298 / CIP 103539 / LMG 7603 / PAl5) TaxID=272568 RepID=A9HED3_GLUDA|nr:putative membrane protein [Gluconacetobacter diazotrophicus PA1 5]